MSPTESISIASPVEFTLELYAEPFPENAVGSTGSSRYRSSSEAGELVLLEGWFSVADRNLNFWSGSNQTCDGRWWVTPV